MPSILQKISKLQKLSKEVQEKLEFDQKLGVINTNFKRLSIFE